MCLYLLHIARHTYFIHSTQLVIKIYSSGASQSFRINYFYHIPRFIDLSESQESIKAKLKKFLWNHFQPISTTLLISFITCALAFDAPRLLHQLQAIIIIFDIIIPDSWLIIRLPELVVDPQNCMYPKLNFRVHAANSTTIL